MVIRQGNRACSQCSAQKCNISTKHNILYLCSKVHSVEGQMEENSQGRGIPRGVEGHSD